MPARPRSVDEYLARLSSDKRMALEQIRKAIRAAAPAAEECFSYGLPAFRLDGRVLVGFGASSGHCALYPMSGTTIAAHEAALAGYETSKGAVRFQADRVLPARLVRLLVRARIAENAHVAGTAEAGKRRPGARRRAVRDRRRNR